MSSATCTAKTTKPSAAAAWSRSSRVESVRTGAGADTTGVAGRAGSGGVGDAAGLGGVWPVGTSSVSACLPGPAVPPSHAFLAGRHFRRVRHFCRLQRFLPRAPNCRRRPGSMPIQKIGHSRRWDCLSCLPDLLLHLICEAEDARALGRGMKGLGVRIARGLNRVMDRRGAVIADRYHSRVLRTPSEVRRALNYLRQNPRRHAIRAGQQWYRFSVDPFQTVRADGSVTAYAVRFVMPARTWLLTVGWRARPGGGSFDAVDQDSTPTDVRPAR